MTSDTEDRRWAIAWINILTGSEGAGQPVFCSRADAELWAEATNREFAGQLLHWVFQPSKEGEEDDQRTEEIDR